MTTVCKQKDGVGEEGECGVRGWPAMAEQTPQRNSERYAVEGSQIKRAAGRVEFVRHE